ncbi:MAG: cell division protein FtsW [Flavobacteriales bacterium CG_4_9_14_3_um_filter_40_17]|nr:MAG: cell division protein FtsW [Flavobacteriales bacterium CG_4_9_14_3_um_filter_40_17]
MNGWFKYLEGDKTIWAVAALLGIFSFLPVYSASSNLVNLYGQGNTISYLFKHLSHLLLGFFIIYGVHKIPYKYFSGLSVILFPAIIALLIYTLSQGNTVKGANASRWLQIPFIGLSFQTSAFAVVVLLVYVARYLSRNINKELTFKKTLLTLWLPVLTVLIFILPANFSTTAIAFVMILILVFIGKHPTKYILNIIGIGLATLVLFILLAKAFPGLLPNRVDTWMSRIENFTSNEENSDQYQSDKAKTAIATGGVFGLGPGKSIQKNFLPQSSSDFIYAIISEEFGMIGAMFLLLSYLLLLFRFVIVSKKAPTNFGALLAIAMGLPIVFQALINMGVAVGLLPVTGQTLPLISSGGTSIWMTCVSLGIILSVSAGRVPTTIENENLENIDEMEKEIINPLEVLSET